MKILLLNYYWPPCGGSAVQRWLDFTNNLSAMGIDTIVVTVDEHRATYPAVDYTLLKRIAPTTEVYRTNTSSKLFDIYRKYIGKGKIPQQGVMDDAPPNLMQKVARFIRGNFLLPDPRKGWNKFALAQARIILNSEKISAIITAGPPHSTHLAGDQLKKEFPDIPWIADFHDYWTEISHLSKFYRTKIATLIDSIFEKRVLRNADYVMTHSLSSVETLQSKISTGKDKIVRYSMGFNEKMFPTVAEQPDQTQKAFIITYTGLLADTYQPQVFFRALYQAIERKPEIPVLLRLVGNIDPEVIKMIEDEGLSGHFEYLGYVSHAESVQLLLKSSALLLVNPHFEGEAGCVPGKIYEYLAAYKPIISISVKGSENEVLINEAAAGRNFDRSELAGITEYLEMLMEQWASGKSNDLVYNPEVNKFSRNAEAAKLAAYLRKA